jgi:hypothetical protein
VLRRAAAQWGVGLGAGKSASGHLFPNVLTEDENREVLE